MRIADSSKPFIPRGAVTPKPSRGNIPYYTRECGTSLWETIAGWKASGYKRTSWSVEPWEKEGTLRARLHNSLRWINDHGTPEQKLVTRDLSFAKVGDEYVLTVKRPPADRLKKITRLNQATPHEEARATRTFEHVRQDVIRFVSTATVEDNQADRPALEIVGVGITDAQRAELEEIINGPGYFVCAITAGYKGSVRVTPLSPSEVAGLAALAKPPETTI